MISNAEKRSLTPALVTTALLAALLLATPAHSKARECSVVNLGNGTNDYECRDIEGKCADNGQARFEFNQMFQGVALLKCQDVAAANPGPNPNPFSTGELSPFEIVHAGPLLEYSTILAELDGLVVVVPPNIDAQDPDFALAIRNNMTDANFESITNSDLAPFSTTAPDVWAIESAQIIQDGGTFSGHIPFQGQRMLCMNQTGGAVSQVRQDIDLSPYLSEVAQGRVSIRAIGRVASSDTGAQLFIRSTPRIGIQGSVAGSGFTQSQIVLNGLGWTELALPGEIPVPPDATSLELQFLATNSTIPNGACLDSIFYHLLVDNEMQVAGLPPSSLTQNPGEVSSVATENFANLVLNSIPAYSTGAGSDFTIAYHTFLPNSSAFDTALTGSEFVDVSASSLSFTGLDDSISCSPGFVQVLQSDLSVVCVQLPPPVPVMSLTGSVLLSVLGLCVARHSRPLSSVGRRPRGIESSS